jgi:predicted O-methyltransferase YrrM
LYDLLKYKEKEKINFKHIYELTDKYLKENEGKFDMAFIDGNHSEYNIIYNDFMNSVNLTREGGIIVFDDYGNFPVVTRVVNDVMKKYEDYKYVLVPFRGHYFNEWSKRGEEEGSGEMLCFKQKEIF